MLKKFKLDDSRREHRKDRHFYSHRFNMFGRWQHKGYMFKVRNFGYWGAI